MRRTRQRLGIAALAVALGMGSAEVAAAQRGTSVRHGPSPAAFADGLAGWIERLFAGIVSAGDSAPAPGGDEVRPPEDTVPDDPGGPIIEPARPPAGPG